METSVEKRLSDDEAGESKLMRTAGDAPISITPLKVHMIEAEDLFATIF